MKEQKPKPGDELGALLKKHDIASTNAETTPKKIAVPKKLDAASEGVLGMLNGGVIGSLLMTSSSLGYSATRQFALKKPDVKYFGDIKNNLGIILGGTAAIALINAGVRASHAINHNTWCEKVDEKIGHLERLKAEKSKPSAPQKG